MLTPEGGNWGTPKPNETTINGSTTITWHDGIPDGTGKI